MKKIAPIVALVVLCSAGCKENVVINPQEGPPCTLLTASGMPTSTMHGEIVLGSTLGGFSFTPTNTHKPIPLYNPVVERDHPLTSYPLANDPLVVRGSIPSDAPQGSGEVDLYLYSNLLTYFYATPIKSNFTVRGAAPSTPTITSFVPNPALIRAGDQSTISWIASNATQLTLVSSTTPNVDVTGKTSLAVTPPETTTYTLDAVDQCVVPASNPTTVVTVVTPLRIEPATNTVNVPPGGQQSAPFTTTNDNRTVNVSCKTSSSNFTCSVQHPTITAPAVYAPGTASNMVTVNALSSVPANQTYASAVTLEANDGTGTGSFTAAPANWTVTTTTSSSTPTPKYEVGSFNKVGFSLFPSKQAVGSCTVSTANQTGATYFATFKCGNATSPAYSFTTGGGYATQGVGLLTNNKAVIASYSQAGTGTSTVPALLYSYVNLPSFPTSPPPFGGSGFRDMTGSSGGGAPVAFYQSPDSKLAMIVGFNSSATPAFVYQFYSYSSSGTPVELYSGTFNSSISASIVSSGGSSCTAASQCIKIQVDGGMPSYQPTP